MLKITKFKLIDLGEGGIHIEGQENVIISENYQVVDTITRTRKLIIPQAITDVVQQMKYYFLNCTGHWMSPFNAYYDMTNHMLLPNEEDENGVVKKGQLMLRDLWSKTSITGLSYREGGFVITGTIEAVEGKKTVINTPFITEEDDLSFYISAMDKMKLCVTDIIKYFSSPKLNEIPPEKILSLEERTGLDADELMNKMFEKMVDKDMIVLVRPDDQDALEESTDKNTKLNTNTRNIDGANIPEVETDDEIAAEDKAVTDNLAANKKQVFGAPASEGEFSDIEREGGGPDDVTGPLDELEHSRNMGIDNEDENEDKNKSEWAE